MIRIAILGSTKGTDLQALLNTQAAGMLTGAEIVTVISNRPNAYILERATNAEVEALSIPSKGKTREEFDNEVLAALQERKIDLVILIGFMRIVSNVLVDAYPNSIMNIHPSLLPKYAGGMNTDVYVEVLKNKETVTGCTLHYVTSDLDEGPIILQEEVPVLADDTIETLKDRVQAAEQVALLKGVKQFVAEQG